ncbi:helix-turn-helix domain-containing protein [Streptomyces sp. GSL17-111]|uniref:helix-turn-helix domain-containing protein n=1 Tax=Streptomyces sp. GSL17-111 TaxID=3121596 RepID=UPI0030F4A6C3
MATEEQRESASGTRRAIADLVRSAREEKGWSQEELGQRIGYTAAAISKLETCKDGVTMKMLALLDRELFDGRQVLSKLGQHLEADRYPPHFKDYALLEQTALSVAAYENMVVDGLLQTEEYARAVLECGYPPLEIDEIDQLTQARMDRKSTLSRRNPVPLIEVVMDESVIQRQVGDRRCMYQQMQHLAEASEAPNVTVQITPLNRGSRRSHAGLPGPMHIVVTPQHRHVVHLEVQHHSRLITTPDRVTELVQRYAMIRAQALSPDQSLELIRKSAEEWKQ